MFFLVSIDYYKTHVSLTSFLDLKQERESVVNLYVVVWCDPGVATIFFLKTDQIVRDVSIFGFI